MQETWVWTLGWEDPLKEEMATHSSILAWRIPWTGKPDSLQSIRLQRVRPDWATKHAHTKAFPEVPSKLLPSHWPSWCLWVIPSSQERHKDAIEELFSHPEWRWATMKGSEIKKNLREMKVSAPFLHGISQGLLLLCNFINIETLS